MTGLLVAVIFLALVFIAIALLLFKMGKDDE
jgi:hypothetical protein